MNLLSVVQKLNDGAIVTAEPALCVNARTSGPACRTCVDACPAGALTVSASAGPQINSLACEGCNLCVPVCPTGVFRHRQIDGLLPRLGTGPTAVVACAAAASDRGGVPCLAGLDPETVAAAALARTLLLVAPDEPVCQRCVLPGHGSLRTLVARAEEVLTAFGATGRIRLAFGVEAAGSGFARGNRVDRRQFLNLVRLRSAATASMVATRPAESARLQDLPARVPAGRRRFLSVLRRLGAGAPERAASIAGHFSRISSVPGGPRCDGCEACTHVCPTGALSLGQPAAGESSLSFAGDRCIACGLCVRACSKGVLELLESFSPAAVAEGRAETVATTKTLTCGGCGTPVRGAVSLCPECRTLDWVNAAIVSLRKPSDSG